MQRSLGSLVAAVALVGFGCAEPRAGGIEYASGKGSVTPEGLHRVDWEPFPATYVKPGADFGRFDTLRIRDLSISYKSPPRTRFQDLSNRRPVHANYALSEEALEAMKRLFREAFEDSFGRSESFSVVGEPGPDGLLLAGRIVDLEVQAPPERHRSTGDAYYSDSFGKLTLILEVLDSQSGELLMQVGERRDVEMNSGGIYAIDPVSGSGALAQIFREWADDLRSRLDHFHSLPELPPAPES